MTGFYIYSAGCISNMGESLSEREAISMANGGDYAAQRHLYDLYRTKWFMICLSNPWVSVDPILQVIKKIDKPIVSISPIIGGKTVKGPAAKMYSELGIEPSALAVAKHYRDFLTGFVLDTIDASMESEVKRLGVKTLATDTLMNNLTDRTRLAKDVLHFTRSL